MSNNEEESESEKILDVNQPVGFNDSVLAAYFSMYQVTTHAREITQGPTVTDDNELAWALRALMMMDLTLLCGDETAATVRRLCLRATHPFEPHLFERLIDVDLLPEIHVASVCVYPTRIKDAYKSLKSYRMQGRISVSAVTTGYPTGQYGMRTRLLEIRHAIMEGATEVDIVVNRQLALKGDWRGLYGEVVRMRAACGQRAYMRAILAINDLGTMENIYKAAMVCMMAGADFIKTTTNIESNDPALSLGLVIIYAIKQFQRHFNQPVGIIAASGLRKTADVLSWMILIKETLGPKWLTPRRFRFSACGTNCATLLNDLDRVVRENIARIGAEEAAKDMDEMEEEDPVDTFCKEMREIRDK